MQAKGWNVPALILVAGVLTLTLRGAGVIDWPWFWAAFPLLVWAGGLLLVLGVLTVAAVLKER